MNIRGDTIQLVLSYTYDGTPIEDLPTSGLDLVLQLNKEGTEGALKFKLSQSQITMDSTLGKYVVNLTQSQTMGLPSTVKYQLTVKQGTTVKSSSIKSTTLAELLRTSEV